MSWFTRSADNSNSRARRMVADGAVLLDVRSPAEFASGHVDGALNIPVQELTNRMGELRGKPNVVVYCRSGARSASAAAVLQRKGYDVVDIGPMQAW